MTAAQPVRAGWPGWRWSAERAARRLAAVTALGAVLGLLVGGVGGRLAMLVLARLNPAATGVTSDDGFRMGQFTASGSLNLLVVGTGLGVLGAGIYAAARALMLGPRWFQVLSVAGGPAVVVGAILVHTDGVDFVLLKPVWLAVALFVALPAVYVAMLTLLVEPRLREDGWFARAPLVLAAAPLALWVPLAPLLGVLVVLWAASEALRRTAFGATALAHPALPWAARLGLAAIFVWALADLTRDVTTLV